MRDDQKKRYKDLQAKRRVEIRQRCTTDSQAAQVFYLDTRGWQFCDERPECFDNDYGAYENEVWLYLVGRDIKYERYARVNQLGHIDYFSGPLAWRGWEKRQPQTLANPDGVKPQSEPHAVKCFVERVVVPVKLSNGITVTVTKFLYPDPGEATYMMIPRVSAETRKSVIEFVELSLSTAQFTV